MASSSREVRNFSAMTPSSFTHRPRPKPQPSPCNASHPPPGLSSSRRSLQRCWPVSGLADGPQALAFQRPFKCLVLGGPRNPTSLTNIHQRSHPPGAKQHQSLLGVCGAGCGGLRLWRSPSPLASRWAVTRWVVAVCRVDLRRLAEQIALG
jgi:hypothetical protein